MRFLLSLLFSFGAAAQPVMPFSPSSGGGGHGSETDPLACKVSGLADCQMLAQIRGNAGTASLPSFASPFASGANDGLYFPSTTTLGLGVEGALRLTLTTTGLTSTVVWQGPPGTAALPSLSFSADPNTGFFNTADAILASTGGTQRLALSTTSLSSTLPFLAPAGTAAAPALSFSGDTNTGLFSAAADDIGVAVNGVSELRLTAATLRPEASAGLDLGTASQLWGTAFLTNIRGNNTTVTIGAGTTATSAQGTVIAGYSDTVDDAAALRIQTATGGGSSGVGVQALVVSESGTTHTDIERIDSTGAGLWGLRTGTVQVGALGANTVGTTPAGLVTCTSTLNGTLAIKTDTDTIGVGASQKPALCVCSRDDAALTYSWKAVTVPGMNGSCP